MGRLTRCPLSPSSSIVFTQSRVSFFSLILLLFFVSKLFCEIIVQNVYNQNRDHLSVINRQRRQFMSTLLSFLAIFIVIGSHIRDCHRSLSVRRGPFESHSDRDILQDSVERVEGMDGEQIREDKGKWQGRSSGRG